MASVAVDDLQVIKGSENLTLYQWNSKTAEHYFCSVCGIYTHHKRRSNPNQYGFNIACLPNVNPYEFDIKVGDGASQVLV